MLLAGSDAAITVVVRPDQWPALTAAVTERTSTVIPPAITSIALSDALGAFWEPLGGPLQGLDTSRPLIFRFGEDSASLVQTLEAGLAEQALPSPRHVFILPAEDVAALRAELEQQIARRCGSETPNCRGFGRPHLEFDSDHVFVIFCDGDTAPSVASLLADPGPTFAWSQASDPVLSMHIRATVARDAATAIGAGSLFSALAHVDASYRTQMLAAGMSELVGAHHRASDHGREIGELAVTVAADPLETRFLAHLTEVGVARLGARGTSNPSPVENATVVVRSGFDLPALAEAATMPFGFRRLEDADEVRRAYRTDGFIMHLQALMSPLAFAHLFDTHGAFDELRMLVEFSPGANRRIDADVHTGLLPGVSRSRELSALAEVTPEVYVRSQITSAAWVGVVSLEPNAEAGDIALSPLRSLRADADSLRCLEALGAEVEGGLRALAAVTPEAQVTMLSTLRENASQHAGCVTAPSLAEEAALLLRVLEVGTAPSTSPPGS